MSRRVGRTISGIAGMLVVRGAGALLLAFLSLYFARAFGAEFSGQFFAMISLVAVFGLATRLGSEQMIIQESRPQPSNQFRPDVAVVARAAAIATLVVAVCYAGFRVLLSLSSTEATSVLGAVESPEALALAAIGSNAVWILGAYLRSIGRGIGAIVCETIAVPSLLTCVILIYQLFHRTPDLDISLLALSALVLPLLVWLYHSRVSLRRLWWRGMAATAKTMLLYAPVPAVNAVIAWLPILLLGAFNDFEGAGVYNGAFRIAMIIGILAPIVKSLVIMHLGRLGPHELRARMRPILIMSGAVALVLIVLSSAIVGAQAYAIALFGEDFRDISVVLPLILIGQSINIGGFVVETFLIVAARDRLLRRCGLITLVVSFAVSPWLIGQFGLRGAAYSLLASVILWRGMLLCALIPSALTNRGSTVERPGSTHQ